MLINNLDKKTFFKRSQVHLISLGLFISILICYWQVKDFEFINFDDTSYVTNNQTVLSGINKNSIIWAFSFEDKSNTYWHPLSWFSHMLDVHLYGLNPGQHHLTNVIFHILNTLLLFLVFYRMTGTIWQPAFVALLFAVHPINVESVAWVAERKNVLSTFFCMLTLLTYAFYNEKPGVIRYIVMVFCFTLGLLAKPMLVTLPFVLLLLDNWPLGRIKLLQPGCDGWRISFHLILEKIPLFLLSGLSIYLASASLQGIGIYKSLQSAPVTLRIANALVSYVKYIGKMIWPQNLAVLYPFPKMVPMYQTFGAFLTLVCVTILVMTAYKKRAYLMIGWFWFLGTLVPVIGLIQAGLWPALADRWAYVPMIGLFIIAAWGISDLLRRFRINKSRLIICIVIMACTLIVLSRNQVGYWKNSVELFGHALEVTADNYLAHNNLGHELVILGKNDEAISHFTEALRIYPNCVDAHYNKAGILTDQNKIDEAIRHYNEALKLNPQFKEAHYDLGLLMTQKGENIEAIRHFSHALEIDNDYAEAHNNLGVMRMQQNRIEDAILHFQKAVRLKPGYKTARRNLAKSLNANTLN